MIPRSLNIANSYHALWSFLESIRHALKRVLHGDQSATPLDREMLSRLVEFLEVELLGTFSAPGQPHKYFDLGQQTRHITAVDARATIESLPEFKAIADKHGKGVVYQKLIKAVQDLDGGRKPQDSLFSRDQFASIELRVVEAMLEKLVDNVEAMILSGRS